MALFNFDVDASPSADIGFNTISTNFGDGYSMSLSNGINNKAESWSVSITGIWGTNCLGFVNLIEVKQFLDDHKGSSSFDWETPLGELKKFVAPRYSLVKRGSSVVGISATFTQVFR